MSTPSTQRKDKPAIKAKRTSISSADEKAKIDASLDKLFQQWPESPYILSVPTLDLLDSHKAQYELAIEKERYRKQFPHPQYSHQYLSNLYRESTDSCFEIRTHVDEERERLMKERERKGMANGSGPATPTLATNAAKKKISLAAYKEKKEKGDISVRMEEKTKPSPELNSASKTIKAESAPALNGNTSKAGSSITTRRENDKKRKSPDLNFTVDFDTPPSPPVKKARATPPPSLQLDHGLPPMLSPIMDQDADFDLPPMLSPTLPADLEEELRKQRERRDSDVLSVSSEPKGGKIDTPSKPEKKAPMKDSQRPHDTSSPDERRELAQDKPIKAPGKPLLLRPAEQDRTSKKRLIVTLEYSRRIEKEVEKIMRGGKSGRSGSAVSHAQEGINKAKKSSGEADTSRQSPSPESLPPPRFTSSPRDRSSSLNMKKPSSNITIDSSANLKKRPSDISINSQAAKRFKPASKMNESALNKDRSSPVEELPATPMRPDSDPKDSQSLVTPRDTTTLARSNSYRSQLSTPRNLTPNPPARIPPPDRTARTEMADWSKKYNDHGRELKHNADAIKLASSSSSSTKVPESALKRKAILTLESIMSYMIAYSFNDARLRLRGLPKDYQDSWATLMPLLRHAGEFMREYPELDGLREYLAYIVNHRHYSNMFAHVQALAAPLNEDPSAPSPRASASQDPPFRTKVHAVTTAPLEGMEHLSWAMIKLPVSQLVASFPQTWAGAAEHTARQDPRTREDLLATRGVNGPYWLPITEITTPPQAVRFGLKFCAEWLEKEGVEHRLSVALERD